MQSIRAATRNLRVSSIGMKNVDYIIIGAGSAGCTLAARLTEDSAQRAAARSRRLGSQPVDQAAVRVGQGAARPHLQLELRDRAGAGARQSPRRMRARQGDRRLVLDQRHGLCARPSRRLRPLGGVRSARLVLRRRAALLPAAGDAGRAARTRIAAATGRSRSRPRAIRTRWSTPISKPDAMPGIRRRPTTTAPSSTASRASR